MKNAAAAGGWGGAWVQATTGQQAAAQPPCGFQRAGAFSARMTFSVMSTRLLTITTA
jgi:hypothetical protein